MDIEYWRIGGLKSKVFRSSGDPGIILDAESTRNGENGMTQREKVLLAVVMGILSVLRECDPAPFERGHDDVPDESECAIHISHSWTWELNDSGSELRFHASHLKCPERDRLGL